MLKHRAARSKGAPANCGTHKSQLPLLYMISPINKHLPTIYLFNVYSFDPILCR